MTLTGVALLYLTAIALAATTAWSVRKLRVLALVVLSLLVGAPLVLTVLFYMAVVPEFRRAVLGPDHRVEARVDRRLGVGLELTRILHLTEYKRRLVTRVRGGRTNVTDLNDDWGPAARTNLYVPPRRCIRAAQS